MLDKPMLSCFSLAAAGVFVAWDSKLQVLRSCCCCFIELSTHQAAAAKPVSKWKPNQDKFPDVLREFRPLQDWTL